MMLIGPEVCATAAMASFPFPALTAAKKHATNCSADVLLIVGILERSRSTSLDEAPVPYLVPIAGSRHSSRLLIKRSDTDSPPNRHLHSVEKTINSVHLHANMIIGSKITRMCCCGQCILVLGVKAALFNRISSGRHDSGSLSVYEHTCMYIVRAHVCI
jgi:hypothetical protein